MLVAPQRRLNPKALVGTETRGINEIAVGERAGLAKRCDAFVPRLLRVSASPRQIDPRRLQLAPRPVNTLGMVRSRIFQSSASDQLSMYCISIFIQVSKSTASRPETAHRQVSPGRIRSRRRCQRLYWSTSEGTAG